MSTAGPRRFAVLDRDGTLIESHHYLSDPDKVRLLPGVAAGLRRLRDMDLGLVMVTNQSAIGRGLFDLDRLDEIHQRLIEQLAAEEIHLDGLYYCPHRPEDACDCRKPRTGLVDRAATEHGFDRSQGFVIGDNICDIDLGEACGATTFLVSSGYGERVRQEKTASPDYLVDDLMEAADIIWGILHRSGDRTS